MLLDLRKIAVNKYDFEATTEGKSEPDRLNNVAEDSWMGSQYYLYKWWDGESDNLRFEIICNGAGIGYGSAWLMAQWIEIKPSIDTNL